MWTQINTHTPVPHRLTPPFSGQWWFYFTEVLKIQPKVFLGPRRLSGTHCWLEMGKEHQTLPWGRALCPHELSGATTVVVVVGGRGPLGKEPVGEPNRGPGKGTMYAVNRPWQLHGAQALAEMGSIRWPQCQAWGHHPTLPATAAPSLHQEAARCSFCGSSSSLARCPFPFPFPRCLTLSSLGTIHPQGQWSVHLPRGRPWVFLNSTSCLWDSSRDALSTLLLKDRELVWGVGSAPLMRHWCCLSSRVLRLWGSELGKASQVDGICPWSRAGEWRLADGQGRRGQEGGSSGRRAGGRGGREWGMEEGGSRKKEEDN